ncbi:MULTISPECIES: hypothetical protein [unclassified Rhizobium]|uniref:hypothetical protein n=1 Tax=unclassified Rhizobium TaxID=2613769 RepID=UPI002478F812|nr:MULTISPECIES: hypothetical protein [unclassified Rhizobium]MDH7800483.1 hypothetical protein [Rhizobium sp. AN70]
MSIERFYNSIDTVDSLSTGDLISCFVYYLAVENNTPATAPKIADCFQDARLSAPKQIGPYLSKGLTEKPPRYVKAVGHGYLLHRNWQVQISKRLGVHVSTVQSSAELRNLETSLPAGPKKDFLSETITCFEAGCNRATITMCWILTIDHLYDHIFVHGLAAFNAVLAKNTDKRVKITSIVKRDDFSEIPEGKFIEFTRSANIISNDVRKILDEKLGIRNSAAHPSGIEIKKSKVVEFVEDLVTNVVLKFPT